jgi:hypothetical protein
MIFWTKLLGLDFIVWLAGSIALGWWLLLDLEKHPVPLNADGTLPGDSPLFPILGASILLFFLLFLANGVYFFAKRRRRPSA